MTSIKQVDWVEGSMAQQRQLLVQKMVKVVYSHGPTDSIQDAQYSEQKQNDAYRTIVTAITTGLHTQLNSISTVS